MMMFDRRPQVFVDMDGVLTDFERWAAQHMGFGWHDARTSTMTDEQKWLHLLVTAPSDFWETMPWLPGGQELWRALRLVDPIVLSSPAKRHPECMAQKITWCERRLQLPAYRVIIVPASRKRDYAVIKGISNILIDDNSLNAQQWSSRGGKAIFHTSTESTIAKLKTLGVMISD